MYSDEKKVQASIERRERETGEKLDITAKEMIEFHKKGDYDIKIHHDQSLKLMLPLSLDMANYFRQMNWVVTHAPKGTSLITTDNPLAVIPPPGYSHDSSYGFGILTRGATKIFPISQDTCLLMLDLGDILLHHDLREQGVNAINLNVANQADRFVIASDETLSEKYGHNDKT